MIVNNVVLIIPCYWKDAENLVVLLSMIVDESTVLPKQIRVSLSDCNLVSSEINNRITFEIERLNANGCDAKVFMRDTTALAGDNRNYAILNSDAEIIVCHDSDDAMHPQKIEILDFWFKSRPDIMLITHWFQPYGFLWQSYKCMEKIQIDEADEFLRIGVANYAKGPLMRGQPAFRRCVFEENRFPEDLLVGEDLKFCVDAQNAFKNGCVALQACLCKYDYDTNINPAIIDLKWEKISEKNGLVQNRTKNGWVENLKLFPSGKKT